MFSRALADLLVHPARLLALWNWKSALLSLVLRGPVFLIATIRRGWEATLAALLTESIFCVVSAGFYGALVETLRDAQPLWLTGIFLTVVVPTVFQGLEYVLHWFRGTPHLRPAEMVSLVIAGLSALFNWYAMRRGTLLVGSESRSLATDVRQFPKLVVGFLAFLPRRLARRSKSGSSPLAGGPVSDDSRNGS